MWARRRCELRKPRNSPCRSSPSRGARAPAGATPASRAPISRVWVCRAASASSLAGVFVARRTARSSPSGLPRESARSAECRTRRTRDGTGGHRGARNARTSGWKAERTLPACVCLKPRTVRFYWLAPELFVWFFWGNFFGR